MLTFNPTLLTLLTFLMGSLLIEVLNFVVAVEVLTPAIVFASELVASESPL